MAHARKELRKKRIKLERLAEEGRLYCEKHDITVGRGKLFIKRCYISRDSDVCPYLTIVKRDNNKI